MSRRGFTLIELMTVISVMGLLASIALPKYQQIRKKADSAETVAAMSAVRLAAFQYNEATGNWPATAASGKVPTGLATYLSGGGTKIFSASYHKLQWTTLKVAGRNPPAAQVITASITDGVVCKSVFGLWGGAGNKELVGSCAAKSGTVTLYVDR